jgi:parallel beta-helix repeat protein
MRFCCCIRYFFGLLILSVFFQNGFSATLVVKQKHNADINYSGNNFNSINEAALRAKPGDTILVFSGIYRELVAPVISGTPDNPIVFFAAPGENPVIKGSDVWRNEWKQFEPGTNVYTSLLDKTVFGKYNPFFIPLKRMSGRLSLGQIFIDGEYYLQVDSLKDVLQSPGSWMLSYDSTQIIVHYKISNNKDSIHNCLVEFSVREKIFSPAIRGLGYIHVEGFAMEHCANQFPSGFYHEKGAPQAGAISTRAGHHWTIRNNTIRFAKSLGIDCGYGGVLDMPDVNTIFPPTESIGYHLIEHNTITDCGAGGIAGAYQRESVIQYNTIERCNNLGFTAPETGGIKVHFFFDGIIKGNLIRDNQCNGIWLDNQWYGSRVTGNTILNCTGQGIFVEMGNGPCLVDNNVVAYTKIGDGIYLHDASGVTIAHNLILANTHFGFYARIVTERYADNYLNQNELTGCFNLNVLNNIFIDNYRGNICLPPEDGKRVKNNYSDFNLFIGGAQWQWEGLGQHTFTIGTNDGRFPRDSLVVELENAFNEISYPDSLRPNYQLWKMQPFLTFDWWKILTGNDKNSIALNVQTGKIEDGAIAKGAFSLSSYSGILEIRDGEPFMQLKAPGLKEVETDFYGNKRTGNEVVPGPFAKYSKGFNKFILKQNQ